jgi:hypothetical protein
MSELKEKLLALLIRLPPSMQIVEGLDDPAGKEDDNHGASLIKTKQRFVCFVFIFSKIDL